MFNISGLIVCVRLLNHFALSRASYEHLVVQIIFGSYFELFVQEQVSSQVEVLRYDLLRVLVLLRLACRFVRARERALLPVHARGQGLELGTLRVVYVLELLLL